MTICNAILTPVVVVIHLLISIARFITETVCNWVTTTIKVVKEIAARICKSLPWPLNKICQWGTKLIEVLETVTEWICENVIKKIIDLVELVLEYVIFILKWVCWLVDWILFRWIALLVCLAGIELRKCVPVCLTILTDERGKPTIDVDAAKQLVADSNELLRQCNINLTVGSVRLVEKPDLIRNVPTGAGQLFSWAFVWFSRNVCDCCSGVTIYFVSTLDSGAKGHAIPGTNYILVAVDSLQDKATIVHEIGHLADLWAHDDEVGNVMSIFNGTPRTRLRKFQCCLIGSARFSRACGHDR